MRIKAVSSLVGGEVLAEPILTEKNDILIPNGTRIKPDYVPLIESLGIESVMVEDYSGCRCAGRDLRRR